MVLFHILDSFPDTLHIDSEDETTLQVHYLNTDLVEDDDEFLSRKRRKTGEKGFNKQHFARRNYSIHLFGTTAEGKPVRVSVGGFRPYFFVGSIPKGKENAFRKALAGRIAQCEYDFVSPEEQEEKPPPAKSLWELLEIEFVQKKTLYGYTANQLSTYAKLSVPSMEAYRALKKIFLDPETSKTTGAGGNVIFPFSPALTVYDATLDPMLRFFHVQNISPCGWVEAPGEPDENGLLDCHWEEVKPVTSPPVPAAPFKIAAWDIECYSESGDFPVPEKDPVIQIGVVLIQPGRETEKHIFVLDSCDEVPGARVYSFDSEKEMLKAWATAMVEWNPDILTGYNIFGFDERYLWKRFEFFKMATASDIQGFTRLADLDRPVKLDEKFLSSSAMGDNTLYTWSSHGRVQIDLYHYIKRNVNLPSYKLDSVCQHFMSGKLGGVEVDGDNWTLKTSSTGDVIAGRYIVLLDETGDVVVDKLQVLSVQTKKSITVKMPEDEDERIAVSSAIKWAVVKDDVSPKEIFTLHKKGGSAGRARIAAYCIQDCDLVYELYKKLEVFNNAMAMANTCPVPVAYIFTRGQGIKIESLIFKECYGSNQLIEVLPNPNRKPGEEGGAAEESYEGAIVLDPNPPGFYFDSPVGVADFASLYPSTIESENISHDSIVWAMDLDLNGKFIGYSFGSAEAEKYKEPGLLYTDIKFDIWGPHPDDDLKKHPRKVVKGQRICRYAQVGEYKGTLPTIVRKLLAARKAKRKEAEKEPDVFRKALLDAEQLAYKLTANSLYGQLGSPTFKIRLQHLAASVTAYGRKQIMFAKSIIERFYDGAQTVYGDTDSLFINFNPKGADGKPLEGKAALEATMHLTEEAGKLVTQALKPPHDFEYDKVFYPFIIFSKKRYVGNKYEEDPDHYTQTSMGIALKRRDNAPVVKLIYGGAIRILLTEKDVAKAATFVREKVMEMVRGKMSMSQLTISKSLRAEYKTPTPPAHKMLANRMAERDPGNAPASGDRIPYVYICPTNPLTSLQGDRIEHPPYAKENGLKLDTKYYIEHQLLNPLSQLFSLCVEEIPGYKAGSTEDREWLAGELLFREALNACEKDSVRTAAAGMGFTVIPKESRVTTRSAAAATPITKKPAVQGTLDRFMLDRTIIETYNAEKKKEKAKVAAKAAAKAKATQKKETS